jgi:hypothetical protein
MRSLAVTLAFGLMATAAPALAQAGGSSLTLKNGSDAPASIIVDGATWRCAGGACVSVGGASQTAERACRRVVAKLGAVTAFTWQGQALGEDKVAACNTSAKH